MKKLTVFSIILVVAAPTLVFSDSFIIKMGYFMPKALNNLSLAEYPDSLWAIEFDQMSFIKNDFRGPMYGFGYERFLTKEFSLVLSVDFYSRYKTGYYLDYVGFDFSDDYVFAFPYEDFPYGDNIGHQFRVSITPLQLSVKFAPLGRRNRFVPYLGGGVGLYFWRVSIPIGQLIEFPDAGASLWFYDYETDTAYEDPVDPALQDVQIYPVYEAYLREPTRIAIGPHAFAGIQIPIGYRITLDAEARYNFVKGKWKSDSAFLGFDDFELSGLVVSGGISFWF